MLNGRQRGDPESGRKGEARKTHDVLEGRHGLLKLDRAQKDEPTERQLVSITRWGGRSRRQRAKRP